MICPFVVDETRKAIRLPTEALLAFIKHAHERMAKEWGDRRKYKLIDAEHELGPWLRS
jgi:hypothetical protein